MKRVIWQPFALYQPSCDFGIYLDRDFAQEMFDAKLDPGRQGQMQRNGYETLLRLGGINRTPYDFMEDTAFVRRFHLGGNGVWLSTETSLAEMIGKSHREGPIEFHSHNIDTLHQQRRLLALVDLWAEHAHLLIE